MNLLPAAKIFSLLQNFRYAVFFPLVVIEGPVVTIIAGFLSSLGYFNFFLVYLVAVSGDLTGDVLHYLFGRIGGRRFVDRWGRFFNVHEKEIISLENQFQKRGNKLLFTGKMLHGAGGAFLIAAGIIKMPFDKFFFSNMIATLAKSLILLLIGFYFGHAFKLISSILEKIALISAGIGILAAIIYFSYLKKNNAAEQNE